VIFLWLKQFKKFILDLLYPIECLNCGQNGTYLCAKCHQQIAIKQQDVCPICKKKSTYGKVHPWCKSVTYLDGILIATRAKDKITNTAIHYFKYYFIQQLKPALAKLLIDKIIQADQQKTQPNWVRLLLGSDNLIVAPVPLHARRLRWRGFNQAELLARDVCQKFNLTLQPNLLRRTRYTSPQAKLKRRRRLKNMRRAFKINRSWKNNLKEAKIILIDDVATSGATLNECAKELKKHGALEVWGLVLKRG